MGSPIVWFELRTANVEKAMDFYGTLFGWAFTPVERHDGAQYWVISTQEGTGSGGMIETDDTGGQDVTLYIAVQEMAASVSMATALGASIVDEPHEISPAVGFAAVLRDPVGSRFGLWSPNP